MDETPESKCRSLKYVLQHYFMDEERKFFVSKESLVKCIPLETLEGKIEPHYQKFWLGFVDSGARKTWPRICFYVLMDADQPRYETVLHLWPLKRHCEFLEEFSPEN